MSQIPQQNQLLEYQGRKVFETPAQPSLYQEQMTQMSTPSFAIVPGFDWAEVASKAAKAGIDMFRAKKEYDFEQKNLALRKIAEETEKELDDAYRMGASASDVEKIRNKAKTRTNATLGFDPDAEDFDETNIGLRNQKLLSQTRKIDFGIQASNAKYGENLRVSNYVNEAVLTSTQIREKLIENPTDTASMDSGIASMSRILGSLLPSGSEVSIKAIQGIQNPADREAAIKIYDALVDVKAMKAKQIKDIAKAEENALKDKQSQEKDMLDRKASIYRDVFNTAKGRLEEINKELSTLLSAGASITPEQTTSVTQLIKEYKSIEDNLDTLAKNYYKEANPKGTEDVTFASDLFANTLSPLTTTEPTVRTAYNDAREKLLNVRLGAAKNTIELTDEIKKSAIGGVKDSLSSMKASIEASLAKDKAEGKTPDVGSYIGIADQFASSAVNHVIGILSANEPALKAWYDKVKPKDKDGKLVTYNSDKASGFSVLGELLNLNTEPTGFGQVNDILSISEDARTMWHDSFKTLKDTKEKIYTASGTTAEKTTSMEKRGEVIVGTRPVTTETADQLEEASDFFLRRTTGITDTGSLQAVKEGLSKNAAKGTPIPTQAIIISPAGSTIYMMSQTPEELVSNYAALLPKDDEGNVIRFPEAPWTKSFSPSSFKSLHAVASDLEQPTESVAFKKASVVFTLLPDSMRDRLVVGKNKATLERLNQTVKDYRGKNIVTLMSEASRGGYPDAMIARATNVSNVGAALTMRTMNAEDQKNVDQVLARTTNDVATALVSRLKNGELSANGLRSFETTSEYVSQTNTGQREAFHTLLKEALYLNHLALSKLPPGSTATVSEAAIEDAIKNFRDTTVVTEVGPVRSADAPKDFVGTTIASKPAPTAANLYPKQNGSTSVLDQDIFAWAASQRPEVQTRFSKQYKTNPKTPVQTQFADAVVTTLNSSGGLSSNQMAYLQKVMPGKDTEILGKLIERTMNNPEETTRRNMLVAAAVIKKLGKALNDPNIELDTEDEVLAYVDRTAKEIHAALKSNKDTVDDTSPYVFSIRGTFIRDENNASIPTSSIGIYEKTPSGNWVELTAITDDLTSAGSPEFTRRGISTNLQIIQSLKKDELQYDPIPMLERKVQALYDRGLLKGDIEYFPVDDETGRALVYKSTSAIDDSKRKHVTQDIVDSSEDHAMKIIVKERGGKVSIERVFAPVSYDTTWKDRARFVGEWFATDLYYSPFFSIEPKQPRQFEDPQPETATRTRQTTQETPIETGKTEVLGWDNMGRRIEREPAGDEYRYFRVEKNPRLGYEIQVPIGLEELKSIKNLEKAPVSNR